MHTAANVVLDERPAAPRPGFHDGALGRLRLRDFAQTRLDLSAPTRVRPGALAASTVLLLMHSGQVTLHAPARPVPLHLGEGGVALLERGSGWELAIGTGEGRTILASLGSPLLPEPPLVPAGRDDGGAELSLVVLGFEDGAEVLERLPPVLAPGGAPSVLASLLASASSFDPGLYGGPSMFSRALELVLLELVRRCPSGEWRSGPASVPVRKALELMRADLAAPWRVDLLAARVGLSRSAFAERFALEMGEPPLHHLTSLRLRDAATRLVQTDAPLKSIAAAVGYESLPSFYKAFRAQFGVAPGVYRHRARSLG